MAAPDKATEIKAAITGAFAFVTALIGWIGWIIVIWIASMLLDYLTGTWAAMYRGEWSSSIARQGLWHKLGSIVGILTAALSDFALSIMIPHLGINFDYPTIITPVVALWYIFTELGSILENMDKLGSRVPPFLRKLIDKARDKFEKIGNEEADKNE